MNQQMNSAEAVERVLAGLRLAEMPEGMEQRVIDAAQLRATKTTRRRAGISSLWLGELQPWTIAALGVVLLALAGVAVQKNVRTRGTAMLIAVPPPPRADAMPGTIVETRRTGPTRENTLRHRRDAAGRAKAEPLSPEEALAISEMNAPSKPAPPLPLTHQEKLLAEAVHEAGREELSSLRPEIRARQMELGQAEFRDFFEPPPAKANE